MKTLLAFIVLLLFVFAGVVFLVFRHQEASAPKVTESSSDIRYLALGDSYTIGQSVGESERWPNQLVERLKANGTDIGIVGNPSVTGYTTQNLIDRELPLLDTANPNFVSILVGVNDYVQGVPVATFQKNFTLIVNAVQAKMPKNRILIITIPDYAKTPTGAQYGDVQSASVAIKSFNDFMVNEAKARGIVSVDIYPISQKVVTDKTLTAGDGLHPSGAQYKLWTDAIYQRLIDAKTF